jgi:hypothetical protein
LIAEKHYQMCSAAQDCGSVAGDKPANTAEVDCGCLIEGVTEEMHGSD